MTQIAPDTFRPHSVAGRLPGHTDPLLPFASVVCLVDRSSAGHAARQQAAALAAEGAVEIIATPRPGRTSQRPARSMRRRRPSRPRRQRRSNRLDPTHLASCAASPFVRGGRHCDRPNAPSRRRRVRPSRCGRDRRRTRGWLSRHGRRRPNSKAESRGRPRNCRSQPNRAPGRGHAGPGVRAGRPRRARDLDRSGSRGRIATGTPAWQHEERQEQSCRDRTARRVLGSAHPRPSCDRNRPPTCDESRWRTHVPTAT